MYFQLKGRFSWFSKSMWNNFQRSVVFLFKIRNKSNPNSIVVHEGPKYESTVNKMQFLLSNMLACGVKNDSLWRQFVPFCGELQVVLFCSCLVMLDSEISHGDSRCDSHRRITMWHKSHFFPRCDICDVIVRSRRKQMSKDITLDFHVK